MAVIAPATATRNGDWLLHMYIHVFMFRWKATATAEHKVAAAQEIREFAKVIPGVVMLTVGDNLAVNNGGYHFGGCIGFADEAAYRAYCEHPLHARLLDWLVPLIDAVELDLPGD